MISITLFPYELRAMFIVAAIIFILIFVGVPVLFMLSTELQRFIVFVNINFPTSPKFDTPEFYGLRSVRNFYITLRETLANGEESSSGSLIVKSNSMECGEEYLGAWFITHENDIDSNEDIPDVLRNTNYPILLYTHGIACNRALPYKKKYNILRKYFHVVAIDYRGYGDSTDVTLTEDLMAEDVIQTYKWLRSISKSDVYIWGHSMGGAISTRAIQQLSKGNQPDGLVIESSFCSLIIGVPFHPIGKFFRWLFYFDRTILYPLRQNGFTFNSSSCIKDVNCPIMIFHAEDDPVVPTFLGKQLYIDAEENRKSDQGTVMFHLIPALGYGHTRISSHPDFPVYVSEFLSVCGKFKMSNSE